MDKPEQAVDREQAQRLLSVLEVTKELAAERSFERLMGLIVRRACESLHCERSSLFLYDEKTDELYTRWVTKLEIDEIRLPSHKGVVGQAVKDRQPLFVDDPYAHPEFDPSFDRTTGFRTRNIVCMPLVSWSDGRLLGVLQLLNKHEGAFSTWERELLNAFAAHAAIAVERAILAEHYRDKVRIEIELDAAREIQTGFFPRELPRPPGYELAAFHQPADATGGDYYDVIPVPDGRLGLVMADVSGHGLGPSLLMASMRAMLRGMLVRESRPDVVLSELGEALAGDLCPETTDLRSRRFRFITVMYGTLDPAAHVFHYANAGHGPVTLHWSRKSGAFRQLSDDPTRGTPLGIAQQSYELAQPVSLEPGDLLVLGTDGVVETRRGKELFGTERLCAMLAQHHRQPLNELVRGIVAATTEFHEGEPSDDLTLLVVRRQG
jgi:serine phosphatase RsbU (regulator of sigma subunit)